VGRPPRLRLKPAYLALLELRLAGATRYQALYEAVWQLYPALQLAVNTAALRSALGEYGLKVMGGLLTSSVVTAAVGALAATGGLPSRFELTFPLSPLEFIAVDLVASYLKSLLSVAISFLAAYAVTGLEPPRLALAVAVGYLGSLGAYGYSSALGALIHRRSLLQRLALQLLSSTLLSLTPVYFPLAVLPAQLRLASLLNPSTWAIEAARGVIERGALEPASLLGLLACSLAWFAAGLLSAYRRYRGLI